MTRLAPTGRGVFGRGGSSCGAALFEYSSWSVARATWLEIFSQNAKLKASLASVGNGHQRVHILALTDSGP